MFEKNIHEFVQTIEYLLCIFFIFPTALSKKDRMFLKIHSLNGVFHRDAQIPFKSCTWMITFTCEFFLLCRFFANQVQPVFFYYHFHSLFYFITVHRILCEHTLHSCLNQKTDSLFQMNHFPASVHRHKWKTVLKWKIDWIAW